MKRMRYVVLAVCLTVVAATAAVAQDWQVVEDHEWCEDRGASITFCEVREVTLSAWGDVKIKTTNGGIHVESWDRDEIRVVARIRVRGGSESSARETVEKLKLYAGEDGIHVKGPKKSGLLGFFKGRDWSVSFHVYVPGDTDVAARTTNGGIHIEGVSGDLDFATTNGGVTVFNASGNVSGETTNGGVTVTLVSQGFHGERVDLHTTNGGINVGLPDEISARIDASVVNGGVSVEHPVKIQEKSRRRFKGTIGDGTQLELRVRTTNGGVHFRRLDA